MVRPSQACHSTPHNYADSHTSQRIQDGGPASAVRGSGVEMRELQLQLLWGKSDTTDSKLVRILILLYCSDLVLVPPHCQLSSLDSTPTIAMSENITYCKKVEVLMIEAVRDDVQLLLVRQHL